MTEPATGQDSPHHRLSVRGRVGALDLHFQASFTAPWTVLFGPSGCGKSTLLRAIAGLTQGLQVEFARAAARTWTTLEEHRHSMAPEKRQLAYAPQQAVLFPHLTVQENVAFGAGVRKATPATTAGVSEAVALFELEPFANRLPKELSGGERQRVSLARALAVPGVRLALLDEPFAGVDRALRDELLPRIVQWFAARQVPVISVTHDVDEVFLLQAEAIRLRDGRILAQGTPETVLADEAARVLRALPPGITAG